MIDTIEEELRGKKILFASVPFEGNFDPLTGLAKYLQGLGCEVRFYASSIFTDKLKDLAIDHYLFDCALHFTPLELNELYLERSLIVDMLERYDWDIINFFAKRSKEYFVDIKNIYQSFPFDMMISDAMFSAIPLVRFKLNIPVTSIGTVPLGTNSIDLAPYGMGFLPPENEEETAEFASLRKIIISVLFKRSINFYTAILDDFGIRNTKTFMSDQLIKQSNLYLQIGIPEFEYKRSDIGENIRFAGALVPYYKKNNTPWFDKRLLKYKKILLVTQGRLDKDMQKLIEPTLIAFRNTDTLVIAVTGGFETNILQKKYATENLIIEDYIPFNDIMPYVKVFVTNGGYGGAILSIENKLPMVAAGVHGGRIEVCTRISYFHCGINLNTETPTSEEIFFAAEEVMANDAYKNNVTRLAEKFSQYNSNELAAGYIAELLHNYQINS